LSPKKRVTPDVLVHNEKTVFLFNPLTARAKEWIEEHVQADAQWFGTTLVVEHRFAWGLAEGMKDAGLVLQ
jgi:squalene cyclase